MRNPFRSRSPDVESKPDTGGRERLLLDVLDALPIGVVVCEADGSRIRNRRASQGVGDYQIDALLRSAIDGIAQEVREAGTARKVLTMKGAPSSEFAISAQSLSHGQTVVVIEDTSEKQRLDSMRRDFVANVSHELRTPIGAINLVTENLLEESDPAAIALLHRHIAAEANRASQLVEKLLALSRLESMRRQSCDSMGLQSLIDEVADRYTPMAAKAEISLRTRVTSAGAVIWGDRDELLSAIGNIVENAIKYSNANTLVSVEAGVSDGTCTISVVDQGIGIPAGDVKRVFERFYRVDPARSRTTGGAGLGLAIVRHVAENHGGVVAVQSREGEGSTFTLKIPVSQ